MNRLRSRMHWIRDQAIRAASHRSFDPISTPGKRIVLIRPDHFGDMLMLAPALNWIVEHRDEDEIVLMTGPWNRPVAEHMVNVDRIVTYPFPGFDRYAQPHRMIDPYLAIDDAASILRALAPRAVVILRDDHWWGAWMAREAGIPLRFGYANPKLEPFLTHPMEIVSKHYVEQNLELIARSLAVLDHPPPPDPVPGQDLRMFWPVDRQASDNAENLLVQSNTREDFVVIHPGSGAPVKLWPAERWATVADSIAAETGLPIVLTGSIDECPLCEAIASRTTHSPIDLCGKTTLFQLAEIFRRATLVAGVDSGPLHLATAVDAPSIHLYGPSDRVRYGPWGDPRRHRVIRAAMNCPRCGDLSPSRPEGCGCMMAITPEMVMRGVSEVLDHAG
jgi:heptosyltransferase III